MQSPTSYSKPKPEVSKFFIDQKIELGSLCDDHFTKAMKMFVIIIVGLYMYGAMILKYVAGAESMAEGISFTMFGHEARIDEILGFRFYYVCLFVFFSATMFFSLGNIENS